MILMIFFPARLQNRERCQGLGKFVVLDTGNTILVAWIRTETGRPRGHLGKPARNCHGSHGRVRPDTPLCIFKGHSHRCEPAERVMLDGQQMIYLPSAKPGTNCNSCSYNHIYITPTTEIRS